jgi:site-specific recombinase XerC
MGIAAAIFMIFVPCRTVALTRIDPTTAKIDAKNGHIKVLAQEKTDFGQGQSMLLFRQLPNPLFSPFILFQLLAGRAEEKGNPHALFVSDNGVAYSRTDTIRKSLASLLLEAGIAAEFTANSIRHALISALFAAGWSETQVNAYTGHSPNYHTALKFYNHLDANWLGEEIAKLGKETGAVREMQAPALAVMTSDFEIAAQEEEDNAE